MKVVGYRLSRLRVPLRPAYVSSQAARSAIERTVLRIETEDGTVGLGETAGSPEVFALTRQVAEGLLGRDALDRNGLRHRFAKSAFQNRNGRNGLAALAGVEMALWDLAGKRYGLPLHELLGGAVRTEVEVAGLMGAVPLDGEVGPKEVRAFVADLGNVERVVAAARELVDRHGFGTLKIKSAGVRWLWDVRVMEALREAFGPAMRLRQDSNGAWSPADALRLCKPLERLNLEFYEDPTHDIDGLARLRRDVRTPIATNMYVVHADHLPLSAAFDAIDVALVDVFHWGGVEAFREAVAACDAFAIEVGLHSHFELGVATACNLHLAAAFPTVHRAVDSVLWAQRGEIVAGPPFVVRDGRLRVPDGPGLGVALDEAAVGRFALEEAAGRLTG